MVEEEGNLCLHVVKDASLFMALLLLTSHFQCCQEGSSVAGGTYASLGFEREKHLNSKHGTLTKTKNRKEIKEFLVEKLSCIMKGAETTEIVLCAVEPQV